MHFYFFTEFCTYKRNIYVYIFIFKWQNINLITFTSRIFCIITLKRIYVISFINCITWSTMTIHILWLYNTRSTNINNFSCSYLNMIENVSFYTYLRINHLNNYNIKQFEYLKIILIKDEMTKIYMLLIIMQHIHNV